MPQEADLPGFRANVLEYVATMDNLARRLLPAVAFSLDLDPSWDQAIECLPTGPGSPPQWPPIRYAEWPDLLVRCQLRPERPKGRGLTKTSWIAKDWTGKDWTGKDWTGKGLDRPRNGT